MEKRIIDEKTDKGSAFFVGNNHFADLQFDYFHNEFFTAKEVPLSFSNCEFNAEVLFGNMYLFTEIKFNQCKFNKSLIFNEIKFRPAESQNYFSIEFTDCDFQDVSLCNFSLNGITNMHKPDNEQPFQFYIEFINCKNINELSMSKIGYSGNLEINMQTSKIKNLNITDIKNIKINIQNTTIVDTKIININELSLANFDSKKIVCSNIIKLFHSTQFDNTTDFDFSKVTFENKLDFTTKIDKKALKITDCIFIDEVDLNNTVWDTLDIKNTHFNKKLLISESSIPSMQFLNCKFDETVKIYNLNNPIKFADFSLSTINSLFLFNGWNGKRLHFEQDSTIDFSNILLKENGYLIIRAINDQQNQFGNFSFKYANILGAVVFTDVYAHSLDLEYSSIIQSFNAEDIHIKNYKNYQTYVRLRNEATKKNDTVAALGYKAEGLKKYRKELKAKKNCRDIPNRILLFFNLISNNFGRSWILGAGFTIGFALLFFVLINSFGTDECNRLFYWGWDDWSNFAEVCTRFLSVINVFDFKFDSKIFKLTSLGEILFFISKIFVGAGIYQTITAFRKYSK